MKIKINGNYYANFTDFSYEQNLDSVGSVFSFACRFDQEERQLFKPLSFLKVQFYNEDDSLFFTGIITNHNFQSNSMSNLVVLSGYSLPGVLEDCNIPHSAYPLESNNMNLREIANKFIKPFGLKLIVDISAQREVEKNYPKTAATPEESIKEYLSKLAAQRNVILSHDENGNLLLFKPNVKQTPVAYFNKESGVEMSLEVSGQDIHSETTNLRQPKPKKEAKKKKPKVDSEEYEDDLGYNVKEKTNPIPTPKIKKVKELPQYFSTMKNPLVSAYRPAVKVLSEGEDFSTGDAVKNQFADELKAIKISLKLDSWQNIKPGDIIEVENEEIYLRDKTKLIVLSISKTRNAEEDGMSLETVIPEAFTGTVPKNIFI